MLTHPARSVSLASLRNGMVYGIADMVAAEDEVSTCDTAFCLCVCSLPFTVKTVPLLAVVLQSKSDVNTSVRGRQRHCLCLRPRCRSAKD